MENNQNPNRPQRKQLSPRDMLIVALVILAITRLDFSNMNSFHVLLLFLVFLVLMLRWGNMRKAAIRRQAMERYKDQYEAETDAVPVPNSVFRWEDAPAESPAEAAPAEEISTDEPAVSEEAEKSAE